MEHEDSAQALNGCGKKRVDVVKAANGWCKKP
jgi:hypothetical protein